MTALTIEQVRAWRPGTLATAAAGLKTAERQVDAEAKAAKSLIETAMLSWHGADADAAAARAAEEAKTGYKLADALHLAHQALKAGSQDIGGARRKLLSTISDAEEKGFTVGSDGSVTAPTLPAFMSRPGEAGDLIAARNAEQTTLNNQAGEIATDISIALGEVQTQDGVTAKALMDVDVPTSLEAEVESFIERLLTSKDLYAALGTGAGALALGTALKGSIRMFGKTSALVKFFNSAGAPITDYQTFLKNINASDDAMRTFRNGKANGGFARFLVGSKAAKLLGKAFLPLTVVTGALDVFTGGGYDGARGWATRGFGLAGVAGAGTLLASSAGLIALGPAGLAIAGGAVLAYGAWTLGNYVWDHREQIGEFLGNAKDWTGDRIQDVGEGLSDAKDYAEEKISGAVDTAKDLGDKALSTVSFGLL